MTHDGTETAGAQDLVPQAEPELKLTVIERHSGFSSVDWIELWRYHELLYFLAWRDIKIRYKQTVFGAAWALLQPLITMMIFTVLFGRFAGLNASTGGIPYPLYVFAGLLPWTFFSNAVTNASGSIVSSANLITKVYFPRLAIPLASIGVALVDFAVSLGLLVVLFAFYRWQLSWQMVFLPLLVIALILFTLGVAAILAALTVTYRDFRYVVPFLLQCWMFVTPVIYSSSIIPERLRWILWLNPAAGLVEGFRGALLGAPIPPISVAVAVVGAVVTTLVGVSYFRVAERRFADIV